MMDHLDSLESQSIYIIREAFNRIDKLALLWSLGKDSNVMVWLCRKAFFGNVPFPVCHVDTGKKFKEMYQFRDFYSKEWNLNLVTSMCPPVSEIDPSLPPAARSAARKTAGLKLLIEQEGYKGLFAGIRRDEESTRSKERYFSPRGGEGNWNFKDQPPEFWDQYKTDFPDDTHIRIHPLLHWSELDIWRYSEREGLPMISLYFANKGKRYRSLGDSDITHPIESNAQTVSEVIEELKTTRTAERSGRAMDHESEDAFERLRADGYM
tara:strand:+ start:826 stop:1623 length:798 start_codon:yes stop_codon:yes gene_type:complete